MWLFRFSRLGGEKVNGWKVGKTTPGRHVKGIRVSGWVSVQSMHTSSVVGFYCINQGTLRKWWVNSATYHAYLASTSSSSASARMWHRCALPREHRQ